MDFIKKNAEKKNIYTIDYNSYLEQFLSECGLVVSITSTEITFHADSVESLNDYVNTTFLNDKLLNSFIYDLGYQIFNLIDDDIGILYFSLEDIIIINSNHFLFINPNKLFSMHEKESYKSLSMDTTFRSKDKDFVPPELIKNSELSKTNYVRGYVGSYYSLGKIILFAFNLVLDDLYYTKLYFFLTRCLDPIPKNRVFLYL